MSVSLQVSDIQNVINNQDTMDKLREIIRAAARGTQAHKHWETSVNGWTGMKRLWVYSHMIKINSDNTITFEMSITKYNEFLRNVGIITLPIDCFVDVKTLADAIRKQEADARRKKEEEAERVAKAERYAQYIDLRAEFEPRWANPIVSMLDTCHDFNVTISIK